MKKAKIVSRRRTLEQRGAIVIGPQAIERNFDYAG